jgi:hypothetical protein
MVALPSKKIIKTTLKIHRSALATEKVQDKKAFVS